MKPERSYYVNGRIIFEIWKDKAGKYHRLDGPAVQYWFESGWLEREEWWMNNEYHRLDGPARQVWYEDGQLKWEVWYANGVFHRLDGPAFQEWDKDGRLDHEFWYINGVKYKTEAEFQVAVDLYKANEIAELF